MSDVPDTPRDPGLVALLELFKERVKDDVRTMEIGVILAYDAASQSATVQPLIQDRVIGEDGKRVPKIVPAIHDVPVMFLGPARARMTWPVASGDLCELRVSSSCISRFVASGGTSPIDPGDARRHDLSDAVAWVGMHSPGAPPTDAPTDAVVVHLGNGITLKFGSSGASQHVPLGDALQGALNVFLTALSTYAVAIKGVADPSNAATPALTSACTALQNAAYLSTKVKLE